MKTVRIKKEELLEILRTNRDKHVGEFMEASEVYREDTLQVLRKAVRNFKAAKDPTTFDIFGAIHQDGPAPRDYSSHYDRAIQMLEMSVDDVVELDREDFKRFVNDDWEWKRDFTAAVSNYSK